MSMSWHDIEYTENKVLIFDKPYFFASVYRVTRQVGGYILLILVPLSALFC